MNSEQAEPRRSWEDVISLDDMLFLRRLRIDPDAKELNERDKRFLRSIHISAD